MKNIVVPPVGRFRKARIALWRKEVERRSSLLINCLTSAFSPRIVVPSASKPMAF